MTGKPKFRIHGLGVREILKILKFLPIPILTMVQTVFTQELPEELDVSNSITYGFYRAGIRYGEAGGDSIHIRWSHNADADTFWVYNGALSLEYIVNENTRTVFYNQPVRYERRMSTHHLKEYIFNSPYRFREMDALAKRHASRLTQFFFIR